MQNMARMNIVLLMASLICIISVEANLIQASNNISHIYQEKTLKRGANLKHKRALFLDALKDRLQEKNKKQLDDDISDARLKGKNEVDPEIKKILPKAALYLRWHRFYDIDHRFFSFRQNADFVNGKGDPNKPTNTNHYQFPIPPLEKIHWEIKQECEKGLKQCLMSVKKAADGSLVVYTYPPKNPPDESLIKLVGNTKGLDWYKYPFGTHKEQFIFRTSASYYLCWYTMQRMASLKHFGTPCVMDKFSPDYRDNDRIPWGCAQLSFCPDPCCGKMNLRGTIPDHAACFKHKNNPCHEIGSGECALDFDNNQDFQKIATELNITCQCESSKPGFKYNNKARMCVDIDECEENVATCPKGELCRNTIGSYKCTCPLGFTRTYDNVGTEGPCRNGEEPIINKPGAQASQNSDKFWSEQNKADTDVGRKEQQTADSAQASQNSDKFWSEQNKADTDVGRKEQQTADSEQDLFELFYSNNGRSIQIKTVLWVVSAINTIRILKLYL